MITSRTDIATFLNETFFTNTTNTITGDQINEGTKMLLNSMWHKNDALPNFLNEDFEGNESREHVITNAMFILRNQDADAMTEYARLLMLTNAVGIQSASFSANKFAGVFAVGDEGMVLIDASKIVGPYSSIYGNTAAGPTIATNGAESAELANINLELEPYVNQVITAETNVHVKGLQSGFEEVRIATINLKAVFYYDPILGPTTLHLIESTLPAIMGDPELSALNVQFTTDYGHTLTIKVTGVADHSLNWTHETKIYKH